MIPRPCETPVSGANAILQLAPGRRDDGTGVVVGHLFVAAFCLVSPLGSGPFIMMSAIKRSFNNCLWRHESWRCRDFVRSRSMTVEFFLMSWNEILIRFPAAYAIYIFGDHISLTFIYFSDQSLRCFVVNYCELCLKWSNCERFYLFLCSGSQVPTGLCAH